MNRSVQKRKLSIVNTEIDLTIKDWLRISTSHIRPVIVNLVTKGQCQPSHWCFFPSFKRSSDNYTNMFHSINSKNFCRLEAYVKCCRENRLSLLSPSLAHAGSSSSLNWPFAYHSSATSAFPCRSNVKEYSSGNNLVCKHDNISAFTAERRSRGTYGTSYIG